jgi:hypothetical protein
MDGTGVSTDLGTAGMRHTARPIFRQPCNPIDFIVLFLASEM